MPTPNERVAAVETWTSLKPADFCRETGIQPGTLSKAKKGPFAPSTTTLNKIIKAYPEISLDWLMHGRGEMLIKKVLPSDKPTQQPTVGPTVVAESDEVRELKRRNRWLEEQVELWQRIAISGIDLSKLATGTDGEPRFNLGGQEAAAILMHVSHRKAS